MTATTRAQVAPTRTAVGLPTQIAVHAGALMRRWSRDPGVIVQAVAFPAFLLAMFQLVLGETVTAMGGGDSIVANTGLVALVGALYGTVAAAVSVIDDRDAGILARQWTLPLARRGFLLGRLLAEALRAGVSTVILFAAATTMGFRFHEGPVAALGAVVIPMVFAVGVAVPILALATVASGREVVQVLSGGFLFLLFFTTGFAPADQYPGWLRPVVEHQPLSPAVEAIAGLTDGGPVAVPVLTTLAWTVGSIAVLGPLAARGWRRAAQGSR